MLLPLNLDALKLSTQRDCSGKLWFRLADVMLELGVNRTNVSFWAGSIEAQLSGSVVNMPCNLGHRNVFCLYVDLQGLIYFALRANSSKANAFRQMVIKSCPVELKELGPCQVYDGREWYLFARLVNLAVHTGGSVPKQTVTTTIKSIPRSEKLQLSQLDKNGKSLSKAWHVTATGAIRYLMARNTPYTSQFKADIARALAQQLEPRLCYLGAA